MPKQTGWGTNSAFDRVFWHDDLIKNDLIGTSFHWFPLAGVTRHQFPTVCDTHTFVCSGWAKMVESGDKQKSNIYRLPSTSRLKNPPYQVLRTLNLGEIQITYISLFVPNS